MNEDFDWESVKEGSYLALRIKGQDNIFWDCVVKFVGMAAVHSGTSDRVNRSTDSRYIVIEKRYNWCSRYPSDNTKEIYARTSRFLVAVDTISKVEVLTRPDTTTTMTVDGFEYVKPSWLSF